VIQSIKIISKNLKGNSMKNNYIAFTLVALATTIQIYTSHGSARPVIAVAPKPVAHETAKPVAHEPAKPVIYEFEPVIREIAKRVIYEFEPVIAVAPKPVAH
jgi:hypothetical protein